ncbi:hypothetical protein BpHYR1_032118, partial [Brachionus plicatilis]
LNFFIRINQFFVLDKYKKANEFFFCIYSNTSLRITYGGSLHITHRKGEGRLQRHILGSVLRRHNRGSCRFLWSNI